MASKAQKGTSSAQDIGVKRELVKHEETSRSLQTPNFIRYFIHLAAQVNVTQRERLGNVLTDVTEIA